MDQRLIEQITDYRNDGVKKLAPMKFKNKATKKDELGLIAQQLQLIEPLAVNTAANGMINIDYEQVTVLLLGYVKQLEERLNNLEQKVSKKNAK